MFFCFQFHLSGKVIMKDMITACPSAVKLADPEGNLPLHLSLRSGKSWYEDGVSDLINVAPSTISARDENNAPPVMLAAQKGDLTTIYILLSKNPDCVSR